MPNEENFQKEPDGSAEIENKNIDSNESVEDVDNDSIFFNDGDENVGGEKIRTPKKISLTAFVTSLICVALAAVMITYNCCINFMRKDVGDIVAGDNSVVTEAPTELDIIRTFFEQFSFLDIDNDALVAAALKAYVDSTGDRYAEYYTEEEWKVLFDESEGKAEGIGINIINSQVVVDGFSQKVFKVINIMKDSPAVNKLRVGDLIVCVGVGEEAQSVEELGYTVALNELKGVAGTMAEFTVFRPVGDGEYERIEFSIERAAVTTTSVYYHVSTLDSKVGIVKILQFDLTTPAQFCEAVDSLKASGCDKFVFDVRYNPGGALDSIEAVLSYFLNEEDPIIHTSDRNGNYVTSVVEVSEYVSAEDIGKYAGLNAVVLCNESTASAAELFTATFRDYDMATIVGVKTYGKGSMQSLFSLGAYGVSGGLKLTTRMYYPPSGEGYDGIGIVPDVEIALDEALLDKNVYEIKDDEDNQLRAALEYFKK